MEKIHNYKPNGNYKVKTKETRSISSGEKHVLQLINQDNNEVVKEQKVSFSDWQLKDDEEYERRQKEWAIKRIKDIETDRPDRKNESSTL